MRILDRSRLGIGVLALLMSVNYETLTDKLLLSSTGVETHTMDQVFGLDTFLSYPTTLPWANRHILAGLLIVLKIINSYVVS